MVRPTCILHKVKYGVLKRAEFEKRGVYKVNKMPTYLKQNLEARNIAVVDAVQDVSIRDKPWKPEQVPPEIPPDFRNTWYQPPKGPAKERSYCLPNSASFSAGILQACLLTKSKMCHGLPQQMHVNLRRLDRTPEILRSNARESIPVGDHAIAAVRPDHGQDEQAYQLAIMQSQLWDPTMDKLPRRKDPEHMGWVFRRELGIPDGKSAKILLTHLLNVANSLAPQYRDMVQNRHLIYKPELDMDYDYLGSTVIIRGVSEAMVYGRQPIPPFVSPKQAASETRNLVLPSMDPMLPTIDLEETDRTPPGTAGGLLSMEGSNSCHAQTMFRATGDRKRERDILAYNVMLSFAAAATAARQKYGITSGVLPEPYTVQNVCLTYNKAHFVWFQLNTLDTHTPDGIKNHCWSHHCEMFKRVKPKPWLEYKREYKPTYYEDLQMEPLKMFLATYMNGAFVFDAEKEEEEEQNYRRRIIEGKEQQRQEKLGQRKKKKKRKL